MGGNGYTRQRERERGGGSLREGGGKREGGREQEREKKMEIKR